MHILLNDENKGTASSSSTTDSGISMSPSTTSANGTDNTTVENLKKLVSKDHRDAKLILGQLRIKRKVSDNTSNKKKLKTKMSYEDYKGAKYLFKIDSLCKTNDIELIVIEMPGYKKTQNNIPIGPNTIIYSNDSLQIYNFNNRRLCKELFNDKNDWLGNSHLNEFGARKLTDYIFKSILKGK